MTFIESSGGGYKRSDDPGERPYRKPRISISDLEAKILETYTFQALVLEIGTGLGVSTRALAKYADLVYTYDIDPWVQETIWAELEKDFPRTIFGIIGLDQAADIIPEVVFIDGDHDPAKVSADIQAVTNLMHGGVIIAHDANYDNVQHALHQEWGDDWAWIPTEHGLAVRVVR